MTVPLTGSGGIMTRLGALGGIMNDVNALRGGANTAEVTNNVPAKVLALAAQYADSPANQSIIDGIYGQLSQYVSSPTGWLSSSRPSLSKPSSRWSTRM